MYNWREIEQLVFCRRFFANDLPNKLAKDIGLTSLEVVNLYNRLLSEFQMLTFLGDLLELLQKDNYKIVSPCRLLDDVPEFDIRPFKKFQNYRVLDLVIATMQFLEHGESILDLSHGEVAKHVIAELGGKLTQLSTPTKCGSWLNLIEPELMTDYLNLLGFKKNHSYLAHQDMNQTEILVNYLKLLGRPAKRNEIRSDLVGFLDGKSMNQKIIDTHGVVIPITKEEFALQEWGFEPFLGGKEIISQYITENGPTHLEMVFAILDGYGFSKKRIKKIASEPPFALIDEVCFLMLDKEPE
jgi:hypothetical protein